MANIEEIDKAIGAHGMWKSRLKTAIESGTIETPVDTIQKDNQCAFGKWLYGETLTAADRDSVSYKTVIQLHAEFHKTAARVVELALKGKKAEANKLMALNGEYSEISAKLTQEMIDWKKSIK